MRKRYMQDDLETKIEELESRYKEINEQNAGLTAQNALLKKQLTYFEDLFAKSSLVGFEEGNSQISKKDLDNFQRNLLLKLGKRPYSQRELEPIPEDELDFIAGKSSNNNDEFETVSNSSNSIKSLRLMRGSSSNSSFSGGYLFLAIVFCMMCCSSFISSASSAVNLVSQQTILSKSIMPMGEGRKLMFNSNMASRSQNLASPLDDEDDIEMVDVREHPKQVGIFQYVQMMLTGEYTYLTYMILSTTCFFFWLTPNSHKI